MQRDGYSEPTHKIRKLTVKWSDKEGDYLYTLTTLQEYDNGERQIVSQLSGDKKWAKNNANHHSLLMPKEEK